MPSPFPLAPLSPHLHHTLLLTCKRKRRNTHTTHGTNACLLAENDITQLGATVDMSAHGFGHRTARYALVADDLKIKYFEVSACATCSLVLEKFVPRGLGSGCSRLMLLRPPLGHPLSAIRSLAVACAPSRHSHASFSFAPLAHPHIHTHIRTHACMRM